MIRCLIASLLLVTAPLAGLSSADEGAKPNILFLFADDQSYEAIGALGLTDIETPHLDRLVKQGTNFTRAYNMGSWSGAVCVASRMMLISGRNLWRAHAAYRNTDQLRQAGTLWPQRLAQAGYQTYFTGKWHIRTNAAEAFQTARHVRPGMPGTVNAAYNRPLADQPDAWSPSDRSIGGFWAGGKHWSEVTGDDGVEFLNHAKDSDKPFFLYVAFNAPHDPRQSPQEYIDRYPLDRIEVPSTFLPEYPYKNEIGCSPKLRDEKLAPFPRTEHAVKVHRQEYYAIITHMDAQIGRILDTLEENGQADNTLIVFTADHGLAVGHHGLFGKQNMYEHSLRVPFLVAGPNIPQGKSIDAPIYLQDVVPTTLEWAGAEVPEDIDFHSLVPLLSGERTESYYPDIYGAYLQLQRAVIHDDWKLIVYPQAQVARLYNLKDDPYETRDLAGDPEHATRKAELFERLKALQRDLGDELTLDALPN